MGAAGGFIVAMQHAYRAYAASILHKRRRCKLACTQLNSNLTLLHSSLDTRRKPALLVADRSMVCWRSTL